MVNIFTQSFEMSCVLFFILGSLLGSFANVIIHRLPQGRSVVSPKSACPQCKKNILWYDNIPLFSWLLLRGRCRFCQARIRVRYPIVELLTGVVFVAIYWKVGYQWLLVEYLYLAFALIVVSFIDLDHMILPDQFTLSGIVIGLLGGALNPDRSVLDALYGVLMGGGFLWAVAYFYWVFRKQEGMGGGDIKLLAWLGAVLGWESVPFIILFSSLVGALVGGVMALKNKEGIRTVIPFGPYLSAAGVLYILGGEEIGQWYIRLFIPQ